MTGITPDEFHSTRGTEDWRVVGDGATAFFSTSSFADAVRFVAALTDVDGIGDHPPDVDLRPGGVTVRLITATESWFGPSDLDVEVARRISEVASAQGLSAQPTSVQSLLIVPGAPASLDVKPFWRAALGYEPRIDSPEEDLVDPHNRGPGVWFEEMDEPRSAEGGGAIHLAVWVAPEEAQARLDAALAAGGRIVYDRSPAWWTLADPAGNQLDIATTVGRG